jgi:hypothetical protein
MTRLASDPGRDIARWIVLLPAAALTFQLLPVILTALLNFSYEMIRGPWAPAWVLELGILAAGSAGAVYVGAGIAPRHHFWAGLAIAACILLVMGGVAVLAGMHGLMTWRYAVGTVVRCGVAIWAALSLKKST